MTNALSRPLPGDHVHITTDPWTEPFWLAAKEGRLSVPRCSVCGTHRLPPTPFCPRCQSQQTDWHALAGTGTIYSYVVCNKSPFPGVDDFIYIPIVVELDDAPGVRLVSNLIDADPDSVAIGQRVSVTWNDIAEGWRQPVFRRLDPA